MMVFEWISYKIIQASEKYKENKRIIRLIRYGLNPKYITREVRIENINNVTIGNGTTYNSGQLFAGINAKIKIGHSCSIGYNVNIKAISHEIENPNSRNREIDGTSILEKDIGIGNNVWIGDNVFIKEGVTIGNNVIIGANAVVTKNFADNCVIGGVPAKLLYNRKN